MSDRAPPRRCGSRKKRGGFCTARIIRGSDRDRQTGRCRFHGGKNLAALPGDPIRGGRPPSSFLYRRHLPPAQAEAFDAAPVGDVEPEIRLAKANLDEIVRQKQFNPKGGLVLSVTNGDGTKTVRSRPWFEIELEHLDKIRRLEMARALMLQQGAAGGSDEDLEAYEEWLKHAGNPSDGGSAPRSSPPPSRPRGRS